MNPNLELPVCVVVIDTNEFAEDFAANLCWQCVGWEDPRIKSERESQISEYQRMVFFTKLFFNPVDGLPYCLWRSKNGNYNSVAIMFESEPTGDEINIIKTQAERFAISAKLPIAGFRLVKLKIELQEKIL